MSQFKVDPVSGLIVPTRQIIRSARKLVPRHRAPPRWRRSRDGRVIFPRPSLASFVAGSFVHNASGTTGTLGAAVLANDTIIVTCSGQTNHATACSDQLGNVYTLLQNTPGSNGHWGTVFSAPVTVPGTPNISVTTTGTGAAISAWAHRGFSSATPHQKGSTGDNTNNPMTVSLVTTVQCTLISYWTNQGSGGSFLNLLPSGMVQLNFDGADFDSNGYLLGQPAGTYLVGANFTSGDSSNEIVALAFPETVTGTDTRPDLMHDTGFPVMLATM